MAKRSENNVDTCIYSPLELEYRLQLRRVRQLKSIKRQHAKAILRQSKANQSVFIVEQKIQDILTEIHGGILP